MHFAYMDKNERESYYNRDPKEAKRELGAFVIGGDDPFDRENYYNGSYPIGF